MKKKKIITLLLVAITTILMIAGCSKEEKNSLERVIESGKLTLTTEQISLKEVVEGIVNIMQPQVKAKRQTFDTHVENILTENMNLILSLRF